MDYSLFNGKIGIENLLLMLVGCLHLWLFWMRRKDIARYHRLWLHWWEGCFFLFYGFSYDIFRYRFALTWLMSTFGWSNLLTWRMGILFVCLVPVYITLMRDVVMYLFRRKSRFVPAAAPPPTTWWSRLAAAFWRTPPPPPTAPDAVDQEILERLTIIEETLSERVWPDLSDLRGYVQAAHPTLRASQPILTDPPPPETPQA